MGLVPHPTIPLKKRDLDDLPYDPAPTEALKKAHTAELILLGEGEQNAVLRPCGQLFRYYFDSQSLHLIGVKNDFTKMCTHLDPSRDSRRVRISSRCFDRNHHRLRRRRIADLGDAT